MQLTARLAHPNTIRIFDHGRTPDRIFYYAMEHLDGATLDEVIAESGPMPSGRVIHILGQTAGALAEAHSVGLIHRGPGPGPAGGSTACGASVDNIVVPSVVLTAP